MILFFSFRNINYKYNMVYYAIRSTVIITIFIFLNFKHVSLSQQSNTLSMAPRAHSCLKQKIEIRRSLIRKFSKVQCICLFNNVALESISDMQTRCIAKWRLNAIGACLTLQSISELYYQFECVTVRTPAFNINYTLQSMNKISVFFYFNIKRDQFTPNAQFT